MTNDNEITPQTIEFHPDFGDGVQMLNMWSWLQKAAESHGATMIGGGIGMGEADIDIELEGHKYNLNIKPIIKG